MSCSSFGVFPTSSEDIIYLVTNHIWCFVCYLQSALHRHKAAEVRGQETRVESLLL